MSLFTRLATALNAKGARLDMEMVALGEGQYRVRVTPNLGACPDNATDEERQLRAHLSSPLTIPGTAQGIDDVLEQRLMERLEIQDVGINALNELQKKMSAAAAAAEKAKPKASGKASTTTKAASQPAPASDDVDDAPAKVSRNDTAAPSLDENF